MPLEKTNILIIGAGKGGLAILDLLNKSDNINVVGIVDVNPEAPAIKLAKELSIPTSTDYKVFINKKNINEIINVTGRQEIQEKLVKDKPKNAEVMDGRSAKIMWSIIDEYKKKEEKIKSSEQEWLGTFDAISDLVFIQDTNYTILKVNKAFAAAIKLKPEEVIGRKCYDLLHKREAPWPECPFELTQKDAKAHTQEVDDPGIGFTLLVTTSPILDEKGKIIGSVHIAKDISYRKKTEEELKKKLLSLERFQKVTVDRELRMKELKAKIAELEAKLSNQKMK